jgi:hypothetical protein
MVKGRIDAVSSNSVDSELLEERQVALTGSSVCQRINETRWFPECVGVAGDDGTYDKLNQWTQQQADEYIPCGWYAIPLI